MGHICQVHARPIASMWIIPGQLLDLYSYRKVWLLPTKHLAVIMVNKYHKPSKHL